MFDLKLAKLTSSKPEIKYILIKIPKFFSMFNFIFLNTKKFILSEDLLLSLEKILGKQ